MKRIVLSVSRFPKLSESFIVDKFIGLLKKGWDVHILCHKSSEKDWSDFKGSTYFGEMKKRTYSVWPIGSRIQLFLKLPLSLLICILKNPIGTITYLSKGYQMFGIRILKKVFQDAHYLTLKPDVIHFEFGAIARDKMYLKELLRSVKMTVSFRGYDLNYVGLHDENYYKPVWRNAALCHFLGEDLRARAIKRNLPAEKPYALISPAIDADLFEAGDKKHIEKVGTKERPLRILSVGRVHWKKGYEYALQAMKLLEKEGVHFEFHIVGLGSYLEEIAFLRYELQLEDKVTFLGEKLRSEIREEYKWADVFLHSAVSEGFCNSVIEAQAMRLPVVCTDADGLSENIAHGETGYIVERRNPSLIAAKLKELAKDYQKREAMGQMGRVRVLEHFQQEKQVDAWDDFYKRSLVISS